MSAHRQQILLCLVKGQGSYSFGPAGEVRALFGSRIAKECVQLYIGNCDLILQCTWSQLLKIYNIYLINLLYLFFCVQRNSYRTKICKKNLLPLLLNKLPHGYQKCVQNYRLRTIVPRIGIFRR